LRSFSSFIILISYFSHAAGAAAGIVDAAFVGSEHLDEEADDALRSVKLAASLAFGTGELAEKVLVNAAEDVFRTVGLVGAVFAGWFFGG
jgi:ATP phosphoribosyltransferase